MKKVMILGASGMLGTSIAVALRDNNPICFDRKDLDITCYSKVRQQFYKYRPEYVINCAAYTSVDKAESEPYKIYKINSHAVGMLATITKQIGATLIHFSTDYVFDGTSLTPYNPLDTTSPINTYGDSKLKGEKLIQRSGVPHYTFRISWLYAPHGKNFFRWVLENDLDEMKVVDNQTGCPTSVIDVADFIRHVINKDPERYGTYHFCNQGSMTWYTFAKAIIEQSGLQKEVIPIKEFPTVAKRPEYSVMDCAKTMNVFQYPIGDFKKSLQTVLTSYNQQA